MGHLFISGYKVSVSRDWVLNYIILSIKYARGIMIYILVAILSVCLILKRPPLVHLSRNIAHHCNANRMSGFELPFAINRYTKWIFRNGRIFSTTAGFSKYFAKYKIGSINKRTANIDLYSGGRNTVTHYSRYLPREFTYMSIFLSISACAHPPYLSISLYIYIY